MQYPPGNGHSGLEGSHCREDTVAADWWETIAARIRSQRIGGRPSPRGYGHCGLEGGHCREDTVTADWQETIAERIRPRRIGGRLSPQGYGRGGLAFWTCRTGRTSQTSQTSRTSRIHKKGVKFPNLSQILPYLCRIENQKKYQHHSKNQTYENKSNDWSSPPVCNFRVHLLRQRR